MTIWMIEMFRKDNAEGTLLKRAFDTREAAIEAERMAVNVVSGHMAKEGLAVTFSEEEEGVIVVRFADQAIVRYVVTEIELETKG